MTSKPTIPAAHGGPAEDEFVSAAEAAAHLGVNLPTLYAYVSRKGVRSVPVPGTRFRRYWRADIERLAQRRSGERNPDELGGASAITLITPKTPYYRGRSAIELADTASLEEVAQLLWDVPSAFDYAPPPPPATFAQLLPILAHEAAVDRASALLPLIERANPRAYDFSPGGMARTGAEVLRWLAAIVLHRPAASDQPLHLVFAEALELTPELTDLVRRMLVLSADHAFEPGTYAVRTVAGTGVTLWRCVMTGLAVATGRYSRFEQFSAMRRFLAEVSESADPSAPVVARLRDGERLPGFDPGVYPEADPRGHALLAACERIFGDADFKRLKAALDAVKEITGRSPNFALASAYAERRLGVGSSAAAVSLSSGEAPFLVGRAAGWIAHAMEQHQQGEARHRAVNYSGRLPG